MSVTQRYQINPDLRVSNDGDKIIIEAAANTYSLSDNALWPFIKEMLSSKEEIKVPENKGEYTPSDLERLESAFAILLETEVLVPYSGNKWPDTIISLSNRSGGIISPKEVSDRLESAQVIIVDPHGSTVVDTLTEMMRQYPISAPLVHQELPNNSSADVMIVVAADEHDPVLDESNEMARSSDIRVWTPLIPVRGGRFRVGPWFYPHQSACYTCLRLRAGSIEREPVLANVQRLGQSAVPDSDRFATQPAMASMMLSMFVDSLLTHLALDGAQGQAPVGGFVDVSYGLEGFEISNHRILRVPRCPECSPASGTGYPQIWFHEE